MEDLSTESIVLGNNNSGDLDSANLETNGNCKVDDDDEVNGDNSVEKSSSRVGADADANRPSPAPKKGYGLKKWRRIRRNDHHVGAKTDTGTSAGVEREKEYDSDSTGRRQKRGPANLLNENDKEGSLNSVKNTAATTVNAAEAASNSFVAPAAPLFNAGVDSDNSEDSISHSHRSSSKSSTAATSKLRSSSKNRIQLAKQNPVVVDTSKKSKGGPELERENENSPRSSMDSDSISSNSVFFRGSGDHNSNSVHHPAPDSLDQARQALAADAAHSPDSSDQLSSTANNHKDHQLPGDGNGDPLNESVQLLHSLQLALQAEVQKFAEIGKGICSLCDDSDKTSGIPVSSMPVDPVINANHASDGLSEFNHAYLSKIIQTLESRLNEAEGRLKEKELTIAESETTMRNLEAHHDLTRRALEQQHRRCTELDDHLLDLFKEKVEAEIKSLVMTRFTKDSSKLLEDRKMLMGEQKSVPLEPTESPKMAEDVENKIAMQQGQAEKLDTHNISTVDGNEEILKMRRGVAKLRNRLFIQLVLLGFVIALFVLQLGPKSSVVVPT